MDETIRSIDSQNYKYNLSIDRVLVVRPKDGDGTARNKFGIIDNRIFNGKNRIHVYMDPQTCLWSVKYEDGVVPEVLRNKFTGYAPLIRFITEYFSKRNIEIVEVLDKDASSTLSIH